MSLHVGQGFDIHRLVEGRKLLLGGVEIEHDKGSDAHSDGDVLLHALIDAMLGGAGMGDIGEMFPPSDPQYKDADSREMLALVLEKLTENGFYVGNVDATIFLETPKLSPYKIKIREAISRILDLDAGNVSVKAKTAEGLPPVGTGDAIAAAVIVSLNQMRA